MRATASGDTPRSRGGASAPTAVTSSSEAGTRQRVSNGQRTAGDRTVHSRGRKGVSDRSLAWLFLAASLWGAWFTWNALRPMAGRSRRGVVSFFPGWLTGELALHHLAWQFGMTLVFAWAGALRAWPGLVGLVITLLSWLGL